MIDYEEHLTTREVDRDDVDARVAHWDRVCRLGCHHDAVVWNGTVLLVSCPRCCGATA
jgi:hypothetical protein